MTVEIHDALLTWVVSEHIRIDFCEINPDLFSFLVFVLFLDVFLIETDFGLVHIIDDKT